MSKYSNPAVPPLFLSQFYISLQHLKKAGTFQGLSHRRPVKVVFEQPQNDRPIQSNYPMEFLFDNSFCP
ncbi:MAG: hypothetical protein LBB80_07980, partial [Treponema sp.]|nr:hypothetical protein [Treponema sp.]